MMHFFAGYFIAALTGGTLALGAPPAKAPQTDVAPVQCLLFADGVQDVESKIRSSNRTRGRPQGPSVDRKVSDLTSVLHHCRDNGLGSERIAIRRMNVRGAAYLLLVDSDSMHTEIARASCYTCVPIEFASIEATRYGSAVARLAKDFKSTAHRHALLNAGLKASETDLHGAVVTADLCPTVKPLRRDFFQEIARLQKQAPVALSVSGVWMEQHAADLEWLKGQVKAGRIDITWVNHSNHHAFRKDHSTEGNFMLLPHSNPEHEILDTERIMIEHGITPSVFFRFPALVSDITLMEAVKKRMLIPLAANAWLAQGQQPHDHSIILVHANGNEHGGLMRFHKLAEERQLPLPMLPLLLAPRFSLTEKLLPNPGPSPAPMSAPSSGPSLGPNSGPRP